MENRGIAKRRRWFKGRFQLLASIGYLIVAVAVSYMGVVSYNHYKKDLIAAEQKELLMMAEIVGKSLVNYVEQELDSIDLYCLILEEEKGQEDLDFIQKAARNYLEKKNGLYDAAAYVDSKGNMTVLYGTMDFSPSMLTGGDWPGKLPGEDSSDIPSEERKAVICGKSLTAKGGYQLYIARKLAMEGGSGFLIYGMDLNEIYRKIVAPVRIGNGGYSIVKDKDLSIIMHHAPNQIGMYAVYDRSEKYPQLDLEDLSEWVEMQQTKREGVGMIHTYVWDDPELSPVERVVAYTTVELPGETWIVNSTIPYKEIEGPLWLMLQRLMGICLAFMLFLSAAIVIITREQVQSRSQKKEIRYLREINEGMELLRRKEEEIQHYQRVQSIGQMSSHIAHEFNNYLTPVMVYAELLEEDVSLGEENQILVAGILKSTNQAADLSRKLLDFSRQETSVLLTAVNVTEDVEAAMEMIRQLAPQKISVKANITSSPFFIRGRKGMMEHILMNLCNNAFHAMEEEGGTLTISLAAAKPEDYLVGIPIVGTGCPSDEDGILLSVCDTGCGMASEVLEKIFEPFYTTKRQGKGTGLGLSVIQNIVAATGGTIRIDTQLGRGTGFHLFFPALSEEEAAEAEPGCGRKKRFLVPSVSRVVAVDDDLEVLKGIQAMLGVRGIECEVFQHPAIVVSKLQKHPDSCDFILTDYSMPYMNGVELCELVRKLNPRIRLVLMSGTADAGFEWYLKNAFIDEFVLKSDLVKWISANHLKG